MTDPIPAQGGDAPAETPASLTSEQIQAIVDGVFEKRIPGLQSSYSKQVQQLEQQIEALRRSNLSDDEIEEQEESKWKAERDEAVRRAAALEAARQYPRGYDIFDQITKAETVEDQLALLDKLVAGSTETPPAEEQETEEEETPQVDPNNPRTDFGDAPFKSEEQALSFLDRLGRWPGN